ncbi:hypothetical protein [Aminipila sp.]|uniref:hypothetical protein n=1 Tax=Aminipila sp. TaxID=2060095 RepID=UPI00289B29C6|nr:hypothetical protein [Aminipila sp.]
MTKVLNFAWPVTAFQYEDYEGLKNCIESNERLFKEKEIIIFGAGIRGSVFSCLLERAGFLQFCFTDNNPEKWGGYINTHPIIRVDQLINKISEAVVIISVENGGTIKKQLEDIGYRENINYFYVSANIYDIYLYEFNRKIEEEILFLGDCGFSQVSIIDNEYNNLASMIKQKLGEENIKILAMHGMGMRGFYNVFKAQIDLNMVPKTLVLMTNFEVFTRKHHILPRTQHSEIFKRVGKFFTNPDEELVEYIKLTAERFSKTQLDVFSVADSQKDENARLVIRMNYMYNISQETEDVIYLFKILELARSLSINVLPFIPSANYMFARTLVGEEFDIKYGENCKRLKAWIKEQGFELFDLSYSLTSDCFANGKTIDETSNSKGREIIKNRLIDELKKREYL